MRAMPQVLLPLVALVLGAGCNQAQTAKPATPPPHEATTAPASPLMPQKPDEPYAKYLERLVKAWPADLTVAYMATSGGVPPTVNRWRVDSQGAGEYEYIDYKDGKQLVQKWPIRLEVADLKVLLAALTEVDFENARRPVPDSPVKQIAIAAAGQTGYLDAYALIPPIATASAQAKVFDALGRLSAQCHAQKAH